MPSCTKCQEDKPEDRYKMCQTCRDLMWERNKAWKAGIKRPRINNRPKAFDYMVEVFKAQKECQLCGKTPALVGDHCHKTNKFRGILCTSCNAGLGFFRDDPELMAKAIEYIQRDYTDSVGWQPAVIGYVRKMIWGAEYGR